MKAKLYANFTPEMTSDAPELAHTYVVFTNGSSNNRGNGEGLILENKSCLVIEVSLYFEFCTTNNQVEYEAFRNVSH